MSAAVLAELERHEWPGNVRELKAVIDRAVLLSRGRDLAVDDLVFAGGGTRPPPPPPPPPSLSPSPARAAAEEPGFLTEDERADRDRVIQALDTCGGNQTRAAKQLQISRTTLVNKLRLYRIPRPRG
jgi:DNA-binding NtrC family response regulator